MCKCEYLYDRMFYRAAAVDVVVLSIFCVSDVEILHRRLPAPLSRAQISCDKQSPASSRLIMHAFFLQCK